MSISFVKQHEYLRHLFSADNIFFPGCNYTYVSIIVEGFYL